MANIPGNWTLFYSWGCGSSYSSTSLTLNANGTFSTGTGHTGKWVVVEGVFLRNYTGIGTIYSGNTSGNVMAGIMTTFDGSTGCWYAKKAGVTPLKAAAKSGRNDAGTQGNLKSAAKKSASKKKR